MENILMIKIILITNSLILYLIFKEILLFNLDFYQNNFLFYINEINSIKFCNINFNKNK